MIKVIKSKNSLKELPFYLMLMPGVIVVLIYSYGPMAGLIMAFQKFNPVKGFFKSEWVGLDNFKYIFKMPDFYQAFWNTLYISILKIGFGLFVPLVLALLINELTKKRFAKLIQAGLFLPYFLSWTIISGIILEVFSLKGPVNTVLASLGIQQIMFMMDNKWFPIILVVTDVWKGMAYSMVIFIAAISNIDIYLYEAANVDGASKWRQTLSITLPSILPITILLLTLSIGNLMNGNFEQVLMLYNPVVYKSGDIIDTFVYRVGIFNSEFAPAAAIGLFKSAISFLLVSTTYYLSYRFSDYRIF